MQEKPGGRKEKKTVPIEEGLFILPSSPEEEARLIGSKCRLCGEVFFPRRAQCARCFTETTEDIALSRGGKVYTCSIVRYPQAPPWQGTAPYAVGRVELPEGVLIPAVFTDCKPEEVRIDMEVELALAKWGEDEQGNEVITFKFRPIRRRGKSERG